MSVTPTTCMNEEICFEYDESMADIANIDWIVRENWIETHTFTGQGSHCITPTDEDVEIVIFVTGTNGCYDTLGTFINLNASPVSTIPDTLYRCEDMWFYVSETPGYADYEWSNGDEDNILTTTEEGTYYLTITDINTCETVDSVVLLYYPGEDIDLVSDTTICMGETVILEFNNSYVYDNIIWSDGHTGTVLNEDTPEIGYEGHNPQFIYVEAYTEHCTFEDTIFIHYDICENLITNKIDNISIYPNPASDYVVIDSDMQIDNIMIYDITGKAVFETIPTVSTLRVDVKNWPDAAYYIQIITKQGEVIKSGFIKI